jgi:hypothetical protein
VTRHNSPIIAVLLTTVGLFAKSKPEFSLEIRGVQSTVKLGSPVEVEVKMTNLTNHGLFIGSTNPAGAYHTYDVRRDGWPVPETELSKKLKQTPPPPPPCKNPPEICAIRVTALIATPPLPPHRAITEIVSVSDYRDMSLPGNYTIQLQDVDYIVSGRGEKQKLRPVGVSSNRITVTLEPVAR